MDTLLRRKHYFQATRKLSLLLAKSSTLRTKKDDINYKILVRSLSTQPDPPKRLFGKLFGPESNNASPEFRSRWLMVNL